MSLRGIIVPLATPLVDARTLDETGLGRLVEHVLGGEVHGIFLLGTTGEGPGLSRRLRDQVIREACRQVAGRVPTLVGITDTSTEEAIELAQSASEAGAAAVVYAGPSYAPVTQEEVLSHVARLADASPPPVFLYNMPSHTGTAFEPSTVRQAAELPGVLGLKDSCGSLLYFQKLCGALAGRPDFSLLMGPEELLGSAVLAGAHGGVNGGANLMPALYVRLYEAATRRDLTEILALQRVVMQVSQELYTCGEGSSSYLRGLKCALSVSGICAGGMAEPYTPFADEPHRRIVRALSRLHAGEAAQFFPAGTAVRQMESAKALS